MNSSGSGMPSGNNSSWRLCCSVMVSPSFHKSNLPVSCTKDMKTHFSQTKSVFSFAKLHIIAVFLKQSQLSGNFLRKESTTTHRSKTVTVCDIKSRMIFGRADGLKGIDLFQLHNPLPIRVGWFLPFSKCLFNQRSIRTPLYFSLSVGNRKCSFRNSCTNAKVSLHCFSCCMCKSKAFVSSSIVP